MSKRLYHYSDTYIHGCIREWFAKKRIDLRDVVVPDDVMQKIHAVNDNRWTATKEIIHKWLDTQPAPFTN